MADAGWSEADAAAVVAAATRHPSMTLTGSELGELLEGPLARLGIKVPDEVTCDKLKSWAGPRPHGIVIPKRDMSSKPHQSLVALRNSIPELEDYWNRVIRNLVAFNPSDADRIKRNAELSISAPISRLRAALDECAHLVQPSVAHKESWELAAISLLKVFDSVIARSGSKVHSGLSPGGPSMSFVCSGLELLGWRMKNHPTEAAILQMLKRHGTKEDI